MSVVNLECMTAAAVCGHPLQFRKVNVTCMPVGSLLKATYRLASALRLGCMATVVVQIVNPTMCVHNLQLCLVVMSVDRGG